MLNNTSEPSHGFHIHTERLDLIAADAVLAESEISDCAAFSQRLGARIPEAWPPVTLADALPFFLGLLRDQPELQGWLTWYGVLRDDTGPVLAGGIGFKGGPDERGMVEIGYSVIPGFQRRGIATEMARAMTAWAFTHAAVACIEADVLPDNTASIRVLTACGFMPAGPGLEPEHIRFRLTRND